MLVLAAAQVLVGAAQLLASEILKNFVVVECLIRHRRTSLSWGGLQTS
jgi:hypothetical protein